MEQIAQDLSCLRSTPSHSFNTYLMGDVLVDAGTRYARRRILRELGGRVPSAHVLTHGHADHQGASAALCEQLGIDLWCPAGDADAVERGDLRDRGPVNPITRTQHRWWAGPGYPVSRRLREGDEVGGFTVIETPGHSPGHVSYWREADHVLVAGDALFGRHPVTGRPGLHEPPRIFTLDPVANRAAIRRLAALEPAVVCFGHGPPLHDPAALPAFAAALPAD